MEGSHNLLEHCKAFFFLLPFLWIPFAAAAPPPSPRLSHTIRKQFQKQPPPSLQSFIIIAVFVCVCAIVCMCVCVCVRVEGMMITNKYKLLSFFFPFREFQQQNLSA